MAMIHISRSGTTLGIHEEAKVREGLLSGEFIGTDLGWTEGMATWQPLSELDSFHTPAPPPPAASQPAALSPQVYAHEPADGSIGVTAASVRTGLPWDNRHTLSFFNALFDTVVMVLTKPVQAFGVMSREGGLLDPLLYALIGGTVGSLVSIAFSFFMPALGALGGGQGGLAALGVMGGSSIFFLVLMPFFVVLGTFILAGLFHVCLLVVGGAKQPFETTYRVVCYASGSANWIQVIPFCGGFIAGLYTLVLDCVGLARAHETDTWRAVVAVALPIIICCGLGVLSFALLIGSTDWR